MFGDFFFKNRAFNEIMWKNFVGPDRPETVSMRISCEITKATDVNSSYVVLTGFSTATMVARTLLNVRVYVHCLSYSFLS
jgi:hypothetical protein